MKVSSPGPSPPSQKYILSLGLFPELSLVTGRWQDPAALPASAQAQGNMEGLSPRPTFYKSEDIKNISQDVVNL